MPELTRIISLEFVAKLTLEAFSQSQVFAHNFHRARAFQAQSLSQLLNCHPRSELHFGYRNGRYPHRNGQPREVSPGAVASLFPGDQRIQVDNLLTFHPDIRSAVDAVFDELEVRVANFRALGRDAQLLFLPAGDSVQLRDPRLTTIVWQTGGQTRPEEVHLAGELVAGQSILIPSGHEIRLHAGKDGGVLLVTQFSLGAGCHRHPRIGQYLAQVGRRLAGHLLRGRAGRRGLVHGDRPSIRNVA